MAGPELFVMTEFDCIKIWHFTLENSVSVFHVQCQTWAQSYKSFNRLFISFIRLTPGNEMMRMNVKLKYCIIESNNEIFFRQINTYEKTGVRRFFDNKILYFIFKKIT